MHANKTFIVTGGGRGLGLDIARAFLAEGANVAISDVNEATLTACSEKLATDHADKFLTIKADSTNDEEVQALIKATVEKFGRLDGLINNAAVNDDMSPVGDCDRSMWEKNILVNLTGPYVTCHWAVQQMMKQDEVNKARGVILNVASSAGMFGMRSGAAYTASKHGLIGLTKNTAAFYGPRGIRCMAIRKFLSRLTQEWIWLTGQCLVR